MAADAAVYTEMAAGDTTVGSTPRRDVQERQQPAIDPPHDTPPTPAPASAAPVAGETVTVSAPTEEKKPCLIIAGFVARATTRTT